MDDIIKTYPFEPFGDDLHYCYEHDLAYQTNVEKTVDYDQGYFDNYVKREGTEVANRLNKARCDLVEKYVKCLVDVGVGSGEFIKTLGERQIASAYGYDINPAGVQWLVNLYVDIYKWVPFEVEGFTLWDTLEHIPNPQEFFRVVKSGQYLFVSLPIFDEIKKVRESKHYKPFEHLYYFSHNGLVRFLDDSGFEFLESNDDETKAGREGIETFVFRKR